MREQLTGKSAAEKANLKGQAIAAAAKSGIVTRGPLRVELVEITAIDGGVEVFARAWKNGKQIGFGIDGTVDIERFRIFNPPILTANDLGDIEETLVDPQTKGVTKRKLKEDPEEALLQALEHTIGVMKVHGNGLIESGKRGNTTSTFYPDATAVDGEAGQTTTAGGASWSTIRDGAGNDATSGASFIGWYIMAGTTTNQWRRIYRGFVMFDTSAIPDTDTISSATLSLYGNSKSDGLSATPNVNVYASAPASNTAIVAGDFDSVGTTSFSTAISYASLSTAAYNDFILNASGIAAISKTGVSKFGTRNASYDAANTPPTWANGQISNARFYGYQQTGTTQDPVLVVTHSAPGASTLSATHTLDALAAKRLTATHTTDALLLSHGTATHAVDALLKGSETASHTADGLLKASTTASATLDTLLKVRASFAHTVSSLILKAADATHTLTALIRAAASAAHSISAVLSMRLSITHALDSLLKRRTSTTHTLSGFLLKPTTSSHSVSAYVEGRIKQPYSDLTSPYTPGNSPYAEGTNPYSRPPRVL